MSRHTTGRYTDFIKAVVPNADVDHGVLKSGRLRAYGGLQILSKAADESELIIAGYASPQVMDREKHVITKEALARDLPRFMAEPEYRNANLLHSNVQVGKVIPTWVDPDTGKRYDTKVDDIGLFAVVKIRTDAARPNICRKVEADIRSGKLSSFSISADAPYESRRYECSNGTCFWVIDAVELYEITICETPVNQDARFTMLTKAYDELGEFASYMWCRDGACPVTPRQANRALLKTFGATEFSAHGNAGAFDNTKRKQLDLSGDWPWPAKSQSLHLPRISFVEAFDSLMEDPGGSGLINRADKPRLPHLDGDMKNADWTKQHDDTKTGQQHGQLKKSKKYVQSSDDVPFGYEAKQGPKGGWYYETEGTEADEQDPLAEPPAQEEQPKASGSASAAIFADPGDLEEADAKLAKLGDVARYEDDIEGSEQKTKVMQRIGAALEQMLPGKENEMLYALEAYGIDPDGHREAVGAENWYQTFASAVTQAWAISSSDHNFASVALQYAISDEFKLPTLEDAGLEIREDFLYKLDDIKNDQPDAHAALRGYVKAVYAETQKDLQAAGVESVPLVRGMTWNDDEAPDWVKSLGKSPEEPKKPIKEGSRVETPQSPTGKAIVIFAGVPTPQKLLEADHGMQFRVEQDGQPFVMRVRDTPTRFVYAGMHVTVYPSDNPDVVQMRVGDHGAPYTVPRKQLDHEFQEERRSEVKPSQKAYDFIDSSGSTAGEAYFADDLKDALVQGKITLPEQVMLIDAGDDGNLWFRSFTKKQADEALSASGGGGKVKSQKFAGKLKTTLNPISSFSTDYQTSRGFGNSGDYKAIAMTQVPRERIFSKWGSGPGCLNEHELTVLGGEMETGFYMTKSYSYNDSLPRTLDPLWEAVSSAKAEKALQGGPLPDMLRKNTDDDEVQYLNEQTSYLQTPGDHGADSTVTPDPEPEYGGATTVKLSGTAEHFHLALKSDLGQLSVDEAVRLAELEAGAFGRPGDGVHTKRTGKMDKDNEASGFPPDSAGGQVITGQDHPNHPKLQGRPKNAKLQMPITGTPSIMRSLDAALSRAVQTLALAEPVAAYVHQARLDLALGDWPLSWDAEPRLFRDGGTWLVKSTATPASLLFEALRKAALAQGDRALVLGLGRLRARLDRAAPLTPRLAMAQAVRLSAQMPEKGSQLDKATPKPEVALKRVRDGVARLVRNPENRIKVPPRLLASLDTILEEAEGAIDGLQLGLTIGLAEDTKLPPRDPRVKYRPAETPTERCGVCRHFRDNGTCALVMGAIKPEMVCNLWSGGDPEHEIIQNAGAGSTYHDVERTDALLESVAKAQMPQQRTQDEAEADDGRPAMATGHDGAMIAWYPTSGTARQFAHEGGEPADELHVTVVYLGKVAALSPEQRQAILQIVEQHVKASPPIEGEITGIEHFEPSEHSEGKAPKVARIEAPDLHIFRDKLVHAIEQAGIAIPNDFPDYKPHMTLQYDLPGMDDMQERGIPEIQSTPIMVDRLVVVFGEERQEFSFDAGGLTQIHGKDPSTYKRGALKAGDEDAVAYGALFQRMWSRGFRDPSYQLVIRKAGGEILDLD